MPIGVTVLYVIAVIFLLIITVLMYIHSPRKMIRDLLTLFLVTAMGLTACMYFAYYFMDVNYIYSLWAIRGTFAFGILNVHSLLEIAYLYPRRIFVLPKATKVISRLLTSFVLFISFTDLIYEGEFLTDGGIEDLHGIFHTFYLVVFLGYLLMVLWLFLKKSFILEGLERQKVRLISSVSFSLSLFVIFVYTVLPKFDVYILQREAVLVSGCLALVLFYAMMKYRFLNVKITLGRLANNATSLVLTSLFILGEYRLMMLLGINISNVAKDVIYVLSGVIVFVSLSRYWIPELFHKVFGLTNFEHFKLVMRKIKDDMDFHSSVDGFEKFLQNVLKEAHIDYAKVVLINDDGKKNKIRIGYSERHKQILIKSEIPYLKHREKWFTKEEMDDASEKGELSIPLYTSSEELFGFVILGPKRFGDLYSVEEVNVLSKMRHHIQLRLLGVLYREQLQREVENKTEELRQRNEEMAYANQKLEKLDSVKDQFLSIVSHELRTPMTVINGFTDLLLSNNFGKLNEKQESFLRIIAQNSLDLRDFVHKMLDVTQLEADKMVFEMEEVDLKDLLSNITEEYQVLAKEKGISLEFEVMDKVVTNIESDPRRLKEIVVNLIANAAKFTDEKGSIKVELSSCLDTKDCDCGGKFVEMAVVDDGIGIAKGDMDSIFDRFHQTKKARDREQKGSGLGLSIVKLLVEKFGGKIIVESKEGKGSKFRILLPIKCAVKNKDNIIKV